MQGDETRPCVVKRGVEDFGTTEDGTFDFFFFSQVKNCWNFAWLEENISVPFALEEKVKENTMCVCDYIDSERDQCTAKGIL